MATNVVHPRSGLKQWATAYIKSSLCEMYPPEHVNCNPGFAASPAPNTQAPASSDEPPHTLSPVYVDCIPLNVLIVSYLPIPYSRNIQVVLCAKPGPQLIWQLDSIQSSSDPCARILILWFTSTTAHRLCVLYTDLILCWVLKSTLLPFPANQSS